MESGWWVDPSLRTLAVDPALLHPGVNTIRLSTRISRSHPGLETVYLLGGFGVSITDDMPRMGALPDSLKLGDWTEQGLPFYAGSVTYRCRIELGLCS
jgi:hypothetical protein